MRYRIKMMVLMNQTHHHDHKDDKDGNDSICRMRDSSMWARMWLGTRRTPNKNPETVLLEPVQETAR